MISTNSKNKEDNIFKIILFLCNWGPHTAFQTLQTQRDQIPNEIKMIRIPCTGRISRALLFKAFAMGADGVALVGCKPGTCRYGSGTATAQRNTQDTGKVLDILGLGKERLKFASFLPDESDELLSFLKQFCHDIKDMGHTTIVPSQDHKDNKNDQETLHDIIDKHDIYACQDCGKCSSACPLALTGKPFSPRSIASAIISGNVDSLAVRQDVWSCLTCGICYDRCPSAVNFPEFIKDLRNFLRTKELTGNENHGGFFHSIMRSMTSPNLKINRWESLPKEIKTDPDSKIMFFGGCAPYYDIFFGKHYPNLETNKILIDSLRLLNFFDVYPALLKDERCCGHDLLWSGDRPSFEKLAKLNIEKLNNKGIEKLITSCPECYLTFKQEYPKQGIKLNFEVVHIYDFLEQEIDKGAVKFTRLDKNITFQDSCRLSRLEQRADLPRKLLSRLKPKKFEEMKESGKSAICCGNSSWIGCDSFSKAMQVKRLEQVHSTDSDLLITACPKCQVHLTCAMEDPFRGDKLKIDMMDLTSVIAKTICWE